MISLSKRWRWFVGGMVLTVVLVAIGSKVVRAHGGDVTKIHACVATNNGDIRIVGASESCRKGESPLDWNIQGIQGPQGPTGPQGPSGPEGPASSVVMLARMNAIPHTFDQEVTYGAPSGISMADANENSVSMVSPDTTLTATNLAVSLTVFVNTGAARRFTLRVNGTDTALSCTMRSFESSCTSNAAVTVPPQSLLSIQSDLPAPVFSSDPTEARIAFQLTE